MARKPWYRRLRDAMASGPFRRFIDAIKPGTPPTPSQPEPEKESPFRDRLGLPGATRSQRFPLDTENRTERQQVYDRILNWFPDDGHWEQGSERRIGRGMRKGRTRKGRKISTYVSPSKGLSHGPASPIRVLQSMRSLSVEDLRAILNMSREEFQIWAREHGFKYH